MLNKVSIPCDTTLLRKKLRRTLVKSSKAQGHVTASGSLAGGVLGAKGPTTVSERQRDASRRRAREQAMIVELLKGGALRAKVPTSCDDRGALEVEGPRACVVTMAASHS